MRRPDFLIIGAARSGTTWLYECLKRHPDVYMARSKKPEPSFFLKDAEYEQGFDYYCQRYFSDALKSQVVGEASTSYLYQPWVPERIHKHLPDVKLIAVLRDPVDRAFSNFKASMENGFENLSFSDAVRYESERLSNPASRVEEEIAPFAYIDRGRYHSQLNRYLRFFPRHQICVLFFEDILQRPNDLRNRVDDFLGIPQHASNIDVGVVRNASQAVGVTVSQQDRSYIIEALQAENFPSADWWRPDLNSWLH